MARRPTPPERVPRVLPRATTDDHLRVMTRAVFQAGLSWAFVDGRWAAFESAFDGFDAARIAAWGEAETARALAADGMIRSAAKIAATVRNARALLDLERELGDCAHYSAGFADWAALRADAKRRFAYVGNLSAYYWCFRTGQRVPPREAWQLTETRDHPRVREMVETARASGVSPEDAGFPLEAAATSPDARTTGSRRARAGPR